MSDPSRKLNWGILGYARIARNELIPAIRRSSNGVLYGLASRDAAKLAEGQAQFGFTQTYLGYAELLADPAIDAVYIPLPNSQHREWAIKAAQAGKHVLCEKPIGLNAAECREIRAACSAHGVVLMEAFMYRYTDRVRQVLEIVKSGVLGEIRQVNSTFRFLLANPASIKLQPSLGGGALYDVGCYPVNFVGLIADTIGQGPGTSRPASCAVECGRVGGIDLILSAVLRYPSGLIASIHCGFNAHKQVGSEIIGSGGLLEIPDTFFGNPGTMKLTTDAGVKEIAIAESDRYRLEVEDFAEAVFGKRPPFFPLVETERNMEVIDLIYSQAAR
jgi:predicted dehydrogenase